MVLKLEAQDWESSALNCCSIKTNKGKTSQLLSETILHTLAIVQNSIDLSNTLEKQLAVTSVDFLSAF